MTDSHDIDLTPDDLAPLLDLLGHSDPETRTLALTALTWMPLPDGAWGLIGAEVIGLLHQNPALDLLTTATRVPVVEVREQIRWMLEAGQVDDRPGLAAALAEVCDDAGVEVLTAALQAAGEDGAQEWARPLARVAPGDATVAREVFEASESQQVRLWLALHLARGRDLDALARVLDDADDGRFDPALGPDLRGARADILACGLPREVVELARSHQGTNVVVEMLADNDTDRPATTSGHADDGAAAALQDACRRRWTEATPWENILLPASVRFSDVLAATIPLLAENPAGVVRFVAEFVVNVGAGDESTTDAAAIPPHPALPSELIPMPRMAAVDPGEDHFDFDDGLESLQPPDEAPSGGESEESEDVYALLNCPTVAVPGDEFELTAGISPVASEGVHGGPLEGLGGRPKPYILSLQVVADGFELRDAESWRHDLAVTEAQPHPQVTLHLTPEDQSEPVRPALITATYSVDGQVVGTATRAIAVVGAGAETPAVDDEVRGADFSIPMSPVAPDLTVVLHPTRQLHLLRMTIESPHAEVPIPTHDVEVDIGGRPDEYAQNLVRAMDGLEGRPELRRELKGRGRMLAGSLPAEFWDALRAAAAASDGPPSLLLVSTEGRVPWELSIVDPPLDPALPSFLSTQTVMGRWVLGDTPLPPPHEHAFGAMAVVTGDYEGLSRWETLQAAFDERDTLQGEYQAESVDATFASVTGLLERDPAPSVVHLAVHGKYNPSASEEGLILTDGSWLTPNGVRAEKIAGRPFVFLNACQVGSGSDELHQYAGLAAAFLASGASGVIAPLWSVKDEIARDIAVGFYAATVEQGLSVGEAIRREREAFAREDGEEPTSATFMAYQYFGHPALKLARAEDGRQ